MKEIVVAIVGPTAVGKTKTGVELAKHFDGEVISGDSMQVYKGLDIGTAKVTDDEKEGIPHHLIDIKEPSESYTAAEFKDRASTLIKDINNKGRIPFIVGGTGMYIRALTRDFTFAEAKSDPTFRKQMEQKVKLEGNDVLYDQLKEVDPITASKTHPNNVNRVIRALEVYHTTKKPLSQFQNEEERPSPYHVLMIGLSMEREQLYFRINQRVDDMIKQGLEREVRWLYDTYGPSCQAAKAIGYKEWFPYFEGDKTYEEAIHDLKRNSRHYAKRQFTWFRNKEDVEWVDMTIATQSSHLAKKKFDNIIHDLEGHLRSLSNKRE